MVERLTQSDFDKLRQITQYDNNLTVCLLPARPIFASRKPHFNSTCSTHLEISKKQPHSAACLFSDARDLRTCLGRPQHHVLRLSVKNSHSLSSSDSFGRSPCASIQSIRCPNFHSLLGKFSNDTSYTKQTTSIHTRHWNTDHLTANTDISKKTLSHGLLAWGSLGLLGRIRRVMTTEAVAVQIHRQ